MPPHVRRTQAWACRRTCMPDCAVRYVDVADLARPSCGTRLLTRVECLGKRSFFDSLQAGCLAVACGC